MRDIESVMSAKAKRSIADASQSVDALPPGYMKGFILQNIKGQLVVGSGIANIRSKRTVQKTEYIISGDDFVAKGSIPPGLFYSVYVSNSLDYKVDSIDPVADQRDFAFYHPTLYGYRYIGQFFMGAGGVYQQVISYDPTGFNSLNTNLVDSLLLAVKEYLSVGYRGSGTPENPQEGDSFLYIDGDEIKVVERTNGSWVDKWRIGGAIVGLIASMVFAAGACHPGYDLSLIENIPANSFSLFNFNNSYYDETETRLVEYTNTVFDSTVKKFGSHSVAMDPARVVANVYFFNDLVNIGNSFTSSSWINLSSPYSNPSSDTLLFFGFYDSNSASITVNDDLSISVHLEMGNDVVFDGDCGIKMTLDEWNLLSFVYDSINEKFYFIKNLETFEISCSGYSWENDPEIYLGLLASIGSYPYRKAYLDETLIADGLCSLDLIYQHYNHNKNYDTTISWSDYSIWCSPGGKIRFFDHMDYPALSPGHIITVEDRPSTWLVDGGESDTNWNDVDLTSLVPRGTTAVTIYGYTEITGASTEETRHVLFRPSGSTETDVTRCEYTPHPTSATGLRCPIEKKILIGADRKFQYQKGASVIHLHISIKEFA